MLWSESLVIGCPGCRVQSVIWSKTKQTGPNGGGTHDLLSSLSLTSSVCLSTALHMQHSSMHCKGLADFSRPKWAQQSPLAREQPKDLLEWLRFKAAWRMEEIFSFLPSSLSEVAPVGTLFKSALWTCKAVLKVAGYSNRKLNSGQSL